MRLGDVNFGNPSIMANHFQGAMTQLCLQREKITAIAQIGDSKGMTKAMRVAFCDVRAFSQIDQYEPKRGFVQRSAVNTKKEWRIRLAQIVPFDKVTPQCVARCLSQIYDASFSAFGSANRAVLNDDASSLLINVGNH